MSYSDYGGYAFRNGRLVLERSDAVLSPEGLKSTPGMWPGWTLPEGRGGRSFHVILGDGPIFVCLHKQSSLSVYRGMESLDLLPLGVEVPAEALWHPTEAPETSYIDTDYYKDRDALLRLEVDGCIIDVAWRESENHYQYVRLHQPDGVVWHGFSGYGVGAGLEDCGYGFSTIKQSTRLFGIFPYATAEQPPRRQED